MPQRPRSHQLEEESRRAFEAALPSAWVSRRHDPDYGVDYTVDIFEGGRATGLSFHAQLKATDEPDLALALRGVRFPVRVADFYRSLANPVLIVRYHASTGTLFARWFHARNPTYLLRTGAETPSATPASIGFRFEQSDQWSDVTPSDLAAGARAFRKFHSPDLPLPLRLAVDVAEERPHGQTAIEHAFGLRRVLTGVDDVVKAQAGAPQAGDASVTFSRETVMIRLGDIASMSSNVDERQTPEQLEVLYADVGLAVAYLLAVVGQANLASTVTTVTAPLGRLIGEPELAVVLAGAMYRARRVPEALDLADQLDERGDEDARTGAMVLLMSALARGPYQSVQEQTAYEQIIRRRKVRRLEERDLAGAASESYNLGVHFRSHGRGREAFRAYREAVRLDARYGARVYFNQELAGVLFELGWPRQAARCYARAVELGAGGIATALLADSLLWAGRYREAAEALEGYLAETPAERDAEWRLKEAVLPLIRRFGGDEQVRQVREAQKLAHLNYKDLTRLRVGLEHALSLDACCGEAWFNYALVLAVEANDLAAGAEAAITGAVLHRTAVGAWQNAVLAASQADTWRSQLRDLLRMAYRFNGDEFIDVLTTPSAFSDAPKPDPTVLHLLEEVVQESQLAREREGFTVRFFGAGGEAFELDLFPSRD